MEQFGELQREFEKTREHLREANSKVDSLTLSEQQYKLEIEVSSSPTSFRLIKNILVLSETGQHVFGSQDLKKNARELSEAIEAERTAHLESKFNSELVQVIKTRL